MNFLFSQLSRKELFSKKASAEERMGIRTDSWMTGSKDRPGNRSGSLYTPFVELGTYCVSECPSWTPRLQGKAFWFCVSSGPCKHHWREAKHYSCILARASQKYQHTYGCSKFLNPYFYIIFFYCISKFVWSVSTCVMTYILKICFSLSSCYVGIILTPFFKKGFKVVTNQLFFPPYLLQTDMLIKYNSNQLWENKFLKRYYKIKIKCFTVRVHGNKITQWRSVLLSFWTGDKQLEDNIICTPRFG